MLAENACGKNTVQNRHAANPAFCDVRGQLHSAHRNQHVTTTIGCSALVALMFLPLGVAMALMESDAPLPLRTAMVFMPSGIAFIAATLLAMRDRTLAKLRWRSVRRKLLRRHDVNRQEYLTHFPHNNPELMAEIRQAISEFFEVPVEKIHPTDDLQGDFLFNAFEPQLHQHVLHCAVARHVGTIPPQIVAFNSAGLSTVGDLAGEVQRIITGLNRD